MNGPQISPGLFEPLTIKSVTLPNRFVMPPMQRGWSKDNVPDRALADYYVARVRGGTGLIIGESSAIDHPSATGQSAAVTLHGDAVPVWAHIVGAVKAAGGHMLLQLWHEGAMRTRGSNGPAPHAPTLSPSGLVWAGRRNGEAATADDLDAILDAYVRAALTAWSIGADGVELHGAHGFLLDQFCWHETNVRADEHGGEVLEARLQFPLRVVRAVREAVGPDFLISWRFSQWKEVDFGARIFDTPSQLQETLCALRAAGVDLFHASTRRFYMPEWPGSDLGLAGWASACTDAPVISVGSVGVKDKMFDVPGEPDELDPLASLGELSRRFDRGDFTLVAVGRALIGDPDWVNKVRDGRFDAIRRYDSSMLGTADWDLALAMEGLGRFGIGH